MHRVHATIYAVNQFNPSAKGNARFSTIHDPSGSVIPTLYAATTARGALMESVFRDVPYRAGFKNVDPKRLEGKFCSTLLFQRDFQLLDLSKVALRGIGIKPRQLIDTTKVHYPVTRRWAEEVYAAHPHLEGFLCSPAYCSAAVCRHRTFSLATSRNPSSRTVCRRILSCNWQLT